MVKKIISTDLLSISRSVLLDEILEFVPDHKKYEALMIANATKATIPEQPLILIEKYGLPMVLIVVLFMILLFLGKFFITQFKNKNEIIAKKDKLIEKKSNDLIK